MAAGTGKAFSTWGYANIASQTSTQVKTGQGMLHILVINKSVASTITLIDGTGDTDPTIATIDASAPIGYYQYDIDFGAGLRIITAGASDLTVSYR